MAASSDMLAFIVDPAGDPKVELVASLVEQLGYIVRRLRSGAELLKQVEAHEPASHLAIVPDSAAEALPLSECIALAAALRSKAFLIYIADAIEPDAYKALVRTGAADWVAWKSSLSEVRQLCRSRKALNVVDAAPAAAPHTVISFFGAGGGVGTTTLALETAVHLASQRGKQARKVAIVDLEPQDSVICDYVDLQPRVNLVELARDPGRLDDYLLDIFTTVHPSGLHIFATDQQTLDLATLDPMAIFALLNKLVEKYDLVVVDAGSQWGNWTESVLAHSDRIYVVARYTVPSVKRMVARLGRLRELGIASAQIAGIVNFCGRNLIGRIHRRPEIDPLFAGIETHFVSADVDLATECVDTGEPVVLAAPRSSLARDLRQLATTIASVTLPKA